MNKKNIFILVMSFLVIHLFGTHSKLLYHLNPDFISETSKIFSFTKFNENTITAMIFALAYSIITASILIFNMNNERIFLFFVFTFALLDSLGVYIYYNTEIQAFNKYGAVFYSIFTFFIVVAIGLSKNMVEGEKSFKSIEKGARIGDIDSSNLSIQEKVISLKNEKKTQTEIARELNISQPQVSRILKNIPKQEFY